MTFGIVGQAVRFFGQIELQRGLGNVEADVEDGGVVLTHTCVNTSRDGCRAEALKQRFEFRTMGRAERALRRITLRAYARRDRSRARRRPPACRREGDSSLSSALQRTKWTVSKIQDAEGLPNSKPEIRNSKQTRNSNSKVENGLIGQFHGRIAFPGIRISEGRRGSADVIRPPTWRFN